MYTVCSASISGDCFSGPAEEDFPCDPGYMLENVTNGTCENNDCGSGEGLSCVPLNCSDDNLPVPANATVVRLPSCGLAYQSQCTVSCNKGFIGQNVTYLCNITNITHDDCTMVDWTKIDGTDHNCTRGVLLYLIITYLATIIRIFTIASYMVL